MGFFHTWIVIYQNFRKNTRGVTEVTEVTRGIEVLIKLLTPEADWGFRLPGLPRLPPAFFMGKMLLIIIILLNFYIYHNFRKKTRWVTEVTEVTEVVIELLTPEADWLPVTAVTPVTSCLFLWGKWF